MFGFGGQNSKFYKVLGVRVGATEEEIKTAYKKLCLKFHPDRNKDPAASDKMKEINEAYQALISKNESTHPDDQHSYENNAYQDSFADFFKENFGFNTDQAGSRKRAMAAKFSYEIQIDALLELFKLPLERQKIHLNTPKEIFVQCNTCTGSGSRGNSGPVKCQQCNGGGKNTVRTPLGLFQASCNACNGLGKSIKDPCSKCHGSGLQKESVALILNAAELYDGAVFAFNRQGHYDENTKTRGSLQLEVKVSSTKSMILENRTLYITREISYRDALLGSQLQIMLADKPIVFQILSNTQYSDKIRKTTKSWDINQVCFTNIVLNVIIKIIESDQSVLDAIKVAQLRK
jgi:molecular chaperone DnaJ